MRCSMGAIHTMEGAPLPEPFELVLNKYTALLCMASM